MKDPLKINIAAMLCAFVPVALLLLYFLGWFYMLCCIVGATISMYPIIKKDIEKPDRHKGKNTAGYVVACFKDL